MLAGPMQRQLSGLSQPSGSDGGAEAGVEPAGACTSRGRADNPPAAAKTTARAVTNRGSDRDMAATPASGRMRGNEGRRRRGWAFCTAAGGGLLLFSRAGVAAAWRVARYDGR